MKNYLKNKPLYTQENRTCIVKRNLNNESNDSINSADCDEMRSYTPQPQIYNTFYSKELTPTLNHSSLGFVIYTGVKQSKNVSFNSKINKVYQSSNNKLGGYIIRNKSKIDCNNAYNKLQICGVKALIDNKGSRCICRNEFGLSQY